MPLPPPIANSTPEERLAFIRAMYVCIADCDNCGICASFHGRDPELALSPYVKGEMEYVDAAVRARR